MFFGNYIGCTRKDEPLFVKDFLLAINPKFIKILYIVIQVYFLHFCIVSKKLVANYASIDKLKMKYQKIQYHEQILVYFCLKCSM